VLLEFVWSSSLISISEKYARNFSITYKNKPIEKLILYEFSLYNDGDIDIDELSDLSVNFYPEDRENFFMDFQAQDNANTIEIHPCEVYEGGEPSYYSVNISRPYLNSKKKLKEENIALYVFSNTPIEKVEIKGGGKSWRASYKDSKMRMIAGIWLKLLPFTITYLLVFFIAIILLFIEFRMFPNFQTTEQTYRAFLVIFVFLSLPSLGILAFSKILETKKRFKNYLAKNIPKNFKEE